jgi:hypothetical protein
VSYTFKDDNLVIDLAAGGAMRLAPAVQDADEGLPHSSAIVTNDLELQKTDMTQRSEPATGSIKPAYVTALEAAYGAPSQAGFESAVFYEQVATADDLDQAALAKYRFFVGDLWDRYGEAAWMGPWKSVLRSPGLERRPLSLGRSGCNRV